MRKGIKSVADFKGKKMSVSSFGGATYGAAVLAEKSWLETKAGRYNFGWRYQ